MRARSFTLIPMALTVACGATEPGGHGALPPGVTCDDARTPALCRLAAGVYTEDLRFDAAREWLLEGNVFVGDGVGSTTLTIEPGTTIYGAAGLSALIVRPGSRVLADGTAERPILFTSAKAEGERGRGDWGGLILSGRAPVNCGGSAPTCEGEGSSGTYGGSAPDDDSGVLRFVRIEFAGARINDEDEYNGLALQGVGAGTVVENIHVHRPSDDGVEFFGGTVDARYVLVTGAGDDGLDWTFGYRGKIQFAVVQQYPDEAGHGIEADNNENDFGASPRSSPTLSHATFLGAHGAPETQAGWLFRRGTEVSISNSIVRGFDRCLDVDNQETFDNASANPDRFALRNNIFHCPDGQTFEVNDEKDASGQPKADPFDLAAAVEDPAMQNLFVDPGMTPSMTDPSFAPGDGSAATSGGLSPADAFFRPAAFRGGVDPARDWTRGWTRFPER